MDPEAIEAAREEAARIAEEAGDEAEPVTCWAENEPALRVYVHCRWRRQIVAGLSGAVTVWEGIDAQELVAAMDLIGIPPESRSDVSTCVRIMEQTALPLKNARSG